MVLGEEIHVDLDHKIVESYRALGDNFGYERAASATPLDGLKNEGAGVNLVHAGNSGEYTHICRFS